MMRARPAASIVEVVPAIAAALIMASSSTRADAQKGAANQAIQNQQAVQNLQLDSGPIALSTRQGSEGIVLQADGRAFAFDTSSGRIGDEVYRVPARYQAVDVAGGVVNGQPVLCFTLNVRSGKEQGSFVLQVGGAGQETWVWLPPRGVYVGVALDSVRGFAYVSNSTTNRIYRVRVGEKSSPGVLATIGGAERLGAITVDGQSGQLYASDMGAQRLHSVDLRSGAVKTIPLPGVEEVRAIVWHPPTRKLYIADSGNEVLWAVNPAAATLQPDAFLRDKQVRQPAGLTAATDGSLWIADERARTIVQVSVPQKAVVRTVKWSPAARR